MRPSELRGDERRAYYNLFLNLGDEPEAAETGVEDPAPATSSTPSRARRAFASPGTMLIVGLALGCILGWGVAWMSYRQATSSQNAMQLMHRAYLEQEGQWSEQEAQTVTPAPSIGKTSSIDTE